MTFSCISDPQRRRFLRQAVTLTGFGAPNIRACINGIVDIRHTFSRSLPPGSLDDWVPELFDGHSAIDVGNRYFVNRHDKADDENVSFDQCVDPDGILEEAMGSEFCHTLENEVKYFELTRANDTIGYGMLVSQNQPTNLLCNNRYNKINPNKIRVGDIVEAQVSFVTVPVRDKRYKLLVVLRAITLLDCQPLKVCVHLIYIDQLSYPAGCRYGQDPTRSYESERQECPASETEAKGRVYGRCRRRD